MLNVSETGAYETSFLLAGIADRLEDSRAAFAGPIADDVFMLQREWWGSDGAGTWGKPEADTLERDARGGRDPRFMRDSGDLFRAATRRHGARGQSLIARSDYLLLGIGGDLHYALYQASAGREPLADPTPLTGQRVAEHLAHFYLSGQHA